MERELIGEFEAIVDQILSSLHKESLAQATEIAAAFMDIRGYGLVKMQAAKEVRERLEKLLNAYLNPVSKAA